MGKVAAPKAGSTTDGAVKGKGKVQQKDDDGEFLITMALQHNMRTMGHCRVLAGVMAGCVAGLLKYEGLSGVFVFFLITIIHSLMIWAKMAFDAGRHFPQTKDIFVNQFGHGLMSFILFWTLAYDMVHIF
eukprot:TRINITY_DN41426_c0_g1_i1.p2 TRINITY_DN41426_c0_g1~~TRINITY_DN41426_c0_g1_i1.p2  ORF type:complete len:130 (-),score=26.31 TRINITY_DN41426_c0_g1_i1:291-680(-)